MYAGDISVFLRSYWTHPEPHSLAQTLLRVTRCIWLVFKLPLRIDRLLKHVKCATPTYLLCWESLLMPRGMVSFTAGHTDTLLCVWVMNNSGLWTATRGVKHRVNICVRKKWFLTTALGLTRTGCCRWLILALLTLLSVDKCLENNAPNYFALIPQIKAL